MDVLTLGTEDGERSGKEWSEKGGERSEGDEK